MGSKKNRESTGEFIASSIVFFVLAVPLFGLCSFLTVLIFRTTAEWAVILGGFVGPILAAVIAHKATRRPPRSTDDSEG
ncbi:hypothetical protein ACX3T8_01970 [Corynebacterium pyruviciproducens]